MTSEEHRVVSITCSICGFHNPDETARCFGCGVELDEHAERRLITVRRPRQRAEAIRLIDLHALRTRVRSGSEELRPGRVPASTSERPRTGRAAERPSGARVVIDTAG